MENKEAQQQSSESNSGNNNNNNSTKNLTSKEVVDTENDKTLAEDDQNDNSSGNIKQRFERINLTLKMIKGKRFGLGIIMCHQRILVCKADDDSLVSGILKLGDQILQVDGTNVHDKNKCRKLLMANLSKKGSVDLSVIRPKTKDALCTIMEEIQLGQKPSIEALPPVVSPAKKPTTN